MEKYRENIDLITRVMELMVSLVERDGPAFQVE